MARRLSSEERLLLVEFVESDGYGALLQELDNLAESIQAGVVSFNVSSDADERQLLRVKLKADGARQFAAALKARLTSLKSSSTTS